MRAHAGGFHGMLRCPLDARHAQGCFVAPRLVALGSARRLDAEHFGPLLHVLRFRAGGSATSLRRALRKLRMQR